MCVPCRTNEMVTLKRDYQRLNACSVCVVFVSVRMARVASVTRTFPVVYLYNYARARARAHPECELDKQLSVRLRVLRHTLMKAIKIFIKRPVRVHLHSSREFLLCCVGGTAVCSPTYKNSASLRIHVPKSDALIVEHTHKKRHSCIFCRRSKVSSLFWTHVR